MMPYQITLVLLVCVFAVFNQGVEALVQGEAVSVVLVGVAAMIESPAEIYYLKSLTEGDMSMRMKAEGGSLFFK